MKSTTALLGFCGWTLTHILVIGGFRVLSVLAGQRKPNSFPSGTPHPGPDWYQRMQRAHANCIENLPIFGAIVLLNRVTQGAPNIDFLATVYFWARIGQSLSHWSSGRSLAINVRFVFFFVQLVTSAVMGYNTFLAL